MFWETFLLAHFGNIRYELGIICCCTSPSLYGHIVAIYVSCHQVKTSETGFLNTSMSSLFPSSLLSHQISAQQRFFGIGTNRNFKLWLCSWQFCSNRMMLRQCGPKSLGNISHTLLNLCRKNLKLLWRQKGNSIW